MLCTMKATDRKILEAMIAQMNQSTARADAALDAAFAFIESSWRRIEAMERASDFVR